MDENKPDPDGKAEPAKQRKTSGKEEFFDVFKSGGNLELFAKSNPKKNVNHSETRTGPTTTQRITDGSGPSIQRASADANGPSITTRITDGSGPSIQRASADANGPSITTRITDGSGPSIQHASADANGPSIRPSSPGAASGPSISRPLSDATGPSIKRTMTDVVGSTTTPSLKKISVSSSPMSPVKKLISTGQTSAFTSLNDNHQPSGDDVKLNSISLSMTDRIAKIMSDQKETRSRLNDLEKGSQLLGQEKSTQFKPKK